MELKYRVTYQQHYITTMTGIAQYDFWLLRLPYCFRKGICFNKNTVRNNSKGIEIKYTVKNNLKRIWLEII